MKKKSISKFFEKTNKNFSKKAQISAQVFTYIMAAIIIAAIVLVGFNGISTILSNLKNAPLMQLESQLRKQISSSSASYMSKELFEIGVPTQYDKICFIDSLDISNINPSLANNYPLIQDKIKNEVEENIFLLKRGRIIHSFYIEKLDVVDDILCIETKGKISVWFEGMGRHACLKLNQNEQCT